MCRSAPKSSSKTETLYPLAARVEPRHIPCGGVKCSVLMVLGTRAVAVGVGVGAAVGAVAVGEGVGVAGVGEGVGEGERQSSQLAHAVHLHFVSQSLALFPHQLGQSVSSTSSQESVSAGVAPFVSDHRPLLTGWL